ncbi:Eukaryotic initiation factor 4A-3 [Porphyridium purpureum]|uniref:RNA helicase n=1 Tax=Porphyridium purpureum TaxID=35688 RepID=A0A5J4YJK3_PORPP|nr:Eukaryotic initiation factor 4A-3 [Porphyridium purpureum]|eukprot:POR5946..scf291_13
MAKEKARLKPKSGLSKPALSPVAGKGHAPKRPSNTNGDDTAAGRGGSGEGAIVPQAVSRVTSFEQMTLREDVLRGLFAYGYERPSRVQSQALPAILSGRDVLAQAQSGTGKTSMTAIAAVQAVRASSSELQVLILSPTRELATQTHDVITNIGQFVRGLRSQCAVGGGSGSSSKKGQGQSKRSVNSYAGVQIVSATPGRACDLLARGTLTVRKVRLLLVDEADEMMTRGLQERLYDIYRALDSRSQIVLVSATMPADVLAMTDAFTTEPLRILVARDALTLEGIRQFYVDVGTEQWKLDALCDLYERITVGQCVVFVNSRKKCEWLARQLQALGFGVGVLHGDMVQRDRDEVMRTFRAGASRVLIATDVCSRGIDVQQLSLVLNFDLPRDPESYLHRIGRSGRFGRRGMAISLVTSEERAQLRTLETFFSIRIPAMPSDTLDVL